MRNFLIILLGLFLLAVSTLDAKSCSAVDSEFKQRVKTLKGRWAREDASLEKRLSIVEKKITALDNAFSKEVDVLMKKNESDKKRDTKREKQRYNRSMLIVEKQRAAYKKREAKAFAVKMKKIEKLKKDRKALKIKISDAEQIKSTMEEAFSKAEKKVLFQIERIRMQNEDKTRKFKREIEEDYQKEFNSLNKKFEEWDTKEEKERVKLTVADKEIETFAATQMEKVEVLRKELDAKRAALNEKKLKPEELEKQEMELDITLAKESDKLNKELNRYRKKKLTEKKRAKLLFKKFLQQKKSYKKRHNKMVKLAQKKRDSRLKQFKAGQGREEKKWERERKMRGATYKKNLERKYGTKRKALQKKLDKLDVNITKSENGLEKFKVKQSRMRGKKESVWKREEGKAEDWRNTAHEEIAVKYENKIMLKRKRMTDKKKKLMTKRDKFIAQQNSVRKKRQKKLNKMKKQYTQQKSRCK
ncbi:hypothetical protein KAH37_04955 [bacterium]|nr:hypothetical protein [bacterium]